MKKYSSSLFIGASLILFLFSLAVISVFYTPYDVNLMEITNKLASPSTTHWLGTDHFGRDILSRVMLGSQTAFLVGSISVAVGLIVGTLIGAIAGYSGGIIDEILMRTMDAMMAFPGILFALMIVAILGVGINKTMIALGVMSIPRFARIARSGFLQAREMMYVKMAQSIGVSNRRIMFVHILPNIVSPLIVAASIGFASAILAEAGLSYLGLGVQPPDPSWGRMLSESQIYLSKAPFYAFAPGLMITIAVLGFNLLGDGIRDYNDPHEE